MSVQMQSPPVTDAPAGFERLAIRDGRRIYSLERTQPQCIAAWPLFFLIRINGEVVASADTWSAAVSVFGTILPASLLGRFRA